MKAEMIVTEKEPRFAFGRNWSSFLSGVTEEDIDHACKMLQSLAGDLRGKSFLDVGSGSGIHSLAAIRLGACRVHSFDYDRESVRCTAEVHKRFAPSAHWSISQGSALDASYIRSLGKFDVVYSWGVLHHTGDMWKALDLVTMPAKSMLILAIYNDQGWQTALWKRLKHRYVLSGPVSRKFLEIFSFAAIWGGSLLYYSSRLRPWTTVSKWRNYNRNRGMSPWTDVVDWAGGYPFEAATPEQVVAFYQQRGFALQCSKLTERNGCNEFVFQKPTEL